MPQRQFTDPLDRRWTVWDVRPARVELELARLRAPRAESEQSIAFSIPSQRESAPEGWLCFETAGHKRRLSPIPAGWERLSDAALVELCDCASDVDRRRTDHAAGSGAHPG